MKTNEFLKKIRAKAKRNELNRQDVRFKKTIALLKGKGLLETNLPIAAATGLRVHLQDAIWAGKNVELRILEVLPAAVLHYPKNFLGTGEMPEDLEIVLRNIRDNAENGPEFHGVPFQKMKRWANTRLKDRRTKPVDQQKIPKYLRLQAKHHNKLKALVAAGKFKDYTSAVEAAIERL